MEELWEMKKYDAKQGYDGGIVPYCNPEITKENVEML